MCSLKIESPKRSTDFVILKLFPEFSKRISKVKKKKTENSHFSVFINSFTNLCFAGLNEVPFFA